MVFRIFPAACLLGLVASSALGQTQSDAAADGFKLMTSDQLAALVAKPGTGPAPVAATLSRHEGWYSQAIARTVSGEVEIHDHWIDIMTVVSGEATLVYGGTVTGNRQTAPGEMRGGAITGGTSVALHVGDYIQIPAGMPHQTVLKPGGGFRVTVVKIKD